MKTWKKIIVGLAALVICCAVGLTGMAEPGIDVFLGPQVTYPTGGLSNQEAGEGYVRSQMGMERSVMLRRNSVTTSLLTDQEKHAYELLKPLMAKVAAGELSSTTFTFSVKELFPVRSLTAAQLGVDSIYDSKGQVTYEALSRFYEMVMPDFTKVMSAMMMDCPYEMYWFDKTSTGGLWWEYVPYTTQGQTILIRNYNTASYSIGFAVAKEYSKSNRYGTFVYDTSKGIAVQTAAANAKLIVSNNAGKSDYQKLKAYKDNICELVDYNYAAVYNGDTAYGNAWQLVWIFDNDPSTKVVCEGYSKAFQYLCDLTSFSGSVSCVSIYGEMNGGPHMWNLVTIGGERYMADITNCDSGSSGYPDKLFLKGYKFKTKDEYGHPVYAYDTGGSIILYTYDSDIGDLVPAEDLTVADNPLGADDGTFVSGTAGSLKWTANGDGVLWVTGSGAVPAYADGMWDKTKLRKVVLDEGVTAVGSGAFTGCNQLREVWFPTTLTSIDSGAFDYPETDYRMFYVPLCSLKAQISFADAHNLNYQVLNHANLIYEPDTDPTCTEDGWRNWMHCPACGFDVKDQVIPALGHKMVDDAAAAPTCTEAGREAGSHCERCGMDVGRAVIPALGHDVIVDAAVKVTCTTDGITEGSHCARCGQVLVKQEVIAALGHDWGEGVITKEPTYEEPGVRSYTCVHCGEKRDEVITKKIHLGKSGWIKNGDGSWSYGDANGDAVTGNNVIDGVMYRFSEEGRMFSGWVQEDGKWYYAEASGALAHNTWKLLGGSWYYFHAQGEMATGWLTTGGRRYYMGTSGAMATGWTKIGGDWYYMDKSGAAVTGWLKDGGVWYWLSKEDGKMATGWIQDGSTWYYMNAGGAMVTGWVKVGDGWYYLEKSGARKTGWLKDGNAWYWLSKEDGKMATGWIKDGSTWYYMSSSGAMKTGWIQVGDGWYYLEQSGAMKTGWLKDGGAWYYLRREDGRMVTGQQEIDGVLCMFGSDGRWLY